MTRKLRPIPTTTGKQPNEDFLAGIMLSGQPFEGAPMHPLGLPAAIVDNARLPAQLATDALSPPPNPTPPPKIPADGGRSG